MRPIEEIGGVRLTRERPYLIVEAGVNHGGDRGIALEMIDAAAAAGADMIKFQSYKAGALASRFSPAYWDREKEPAASQFELFARYDALEPSDYSLLAERCEARGIAFGATPFDERFVDELVPLMPVVKVASADLTNDPLLRRVAAHGKPVLLSTGASRLDEIEDAVDTLVAAGAPALGLLHCTLEYPTPPEHANLRAIVTLRESFPEATPGWSDHVPPDSGCHSLLTAWLLGADILEKHFSLDRSLSGNDHYHALDPNDVRDFVALQRSVAAMLGDGDKTVSPGEESARRYARRSVVVTRDLAAGSVLGAEDLAVKRPGTGIPPVELGQVVGCSLVRDVKEDEVLAWAALERAGAERTSDAPVARGGR